MDKRSFKGQPYSYKRMADISMKLGHTVATEFGRGKSIDEIASKWKMPPSLVRRIINRHHEILAKR